MERHYIDNREKYKNHKSGCKEMNKAVYYKFLFFFAGIWNIMASVVFAIFAPIFPQFLAFFGFTTVVNETLFWMYGFLIFTLVEGFGYFLVGLDFTKNHLVISTGMITKFGIAIIAIVFFIIGPVKWPVLVMGIVDIIFSALFIEFYVNYKRLLDSDIQGAYRYQEK